MDPLTAHRFQFAFTVTYHYLFPQLTMGLSMFIVILKVMGMRGDTAATELSRFWTRIFGLNFVLGVVTGIPLEFQFGTNWARFSQASGGVIGQTLAMEGVFAFFMESSFLYLLLFAEKRLGPRLHLLAAVLVWLGTWLSGWFIVCTNAFMQHPVGHRVRDDGVIVLDSLTALLTNPWAIVQYAHTMVGSVVTASFVVAGLGAFYLLAGRAEAHARKSLSVGVRVGVVACLLAGFPTGDLQAKLVAEHQPITFAAMEGHFASEDGAGLVLIGQPNMQRLTLDNPLVVPNMLSFMTHQRWSARVPGLREFPRDEWPDNVPMLYYAYHIMVGLGTLFIALMGLSAWALWRGRLHALRPLLWALMLATPFPYVANTAGWMTAEFGRQPWLIHGLMRTADGSSDNVSSGSVLFSLLGFMGLYAMLSMLGLFVVARIVAAGPEPGPQPPHAPAEQG